MHLDFRFIKAASCGNLDEAKCLLGQGANLHAHRNAAFMKAAAKGHLAVVQYLLEQGVELHFENDFALRLAASNGHLALVEFLVERGANLHAVDDYAVRSAASKGHLDVVKYLLEQGADSDRIYREDLIKFFTSYDLQIEKITPRLSSIILKIKCLNTPCKKSRRNKILSSYKKKMIFSLFILMYRIYYRPGGPGYFRAIE